MRYDPGMHPAWLWGGFLLLLILHLLWCHFVAYPASFERMLRQGKSWVYIPLRWKGFHKIQVLILSRLLLLGIAAAGTTLAVFHTGRREPWWIAAFGTGLLLLTLRLDAWWIRLRYRQQEDAYYLLHDELRAQLEREGKDFTEPKFRNLAVYQHQQRLRKADEAGELLSELRREARRSRASGPHRERAEA